MVGDMQQVIVTDGDPHNPASSAILVHHRGFPEIRAEGLSAGDAAGQLLERFRSALDSTPNHWHRSDLEQALADVQAFLAQGGQLMAGRISSSALGNRAAVDRRDHTV